MNLTDYIAAAPEMVLLGLICVVMIADLFVDDENRALTFRLSLASLAVTAHSQDGDDRLCRHLVPVCAGLPAGQ
jgi:NADH-quinone oxidoreductase subunit N